MVMDTSPWQLDTQATRPGFSRAMPCRVRENGLQDSLRAVGGDGGRTAPSPRPLQESPDRVAPERPVVPEDPGPELGVDGDPLALEEAGEVPVLADERVVLAGGDEPLDLAEALDEPLVGVRDEGLGTVVVAEVVPVAVEELPDVVEAREEDRLRDEARVAAGEVRGVVGAEGGAADAEVAAARAVLDVGDELVP